MPSYPYLNFPFFPYRRYHYNTYNDTSNLHNQNLQNSFPEKSSQNEDFSSKIDEKSQNNIVKEDCLFDLFGLKLYFDDILLICLIFFLYNEGVKDEGLFFALILLLLT